MTSPAENILVAMSGGVDSSVAAALLQRAGYRITGAYMKNWINEDNIVGDCPWQQDIEDARAVCEQLGIEFRVVNLMDQYRERVVEYLLEGYRAGITPNPDVMCNREVKFGAFLEYALAEGFDAVATGHYAKRCVAASGDAELLEGVDGNKDQSYFLALINQRQLAHARFPLGALTKSEVRAYADQLNLPVATKKDSQGICFIGQVKMSDFLSNYVADDPGDIVTPEGEKLGQHRGLHYFTLGQRRGIGVASNTYNRAYVVVEKRAHSKELVVAFDYPDTPGLYAKHCTVSALSFVRDEISDISTISARPRYRTPKVPVEFIPLGAGRAELRFEAAQRALTPGQVCAFYLDNQLLGGGIFEEIIYE